MFDTATIAPETIRPLSRSEYDILVEQGVLEDERVELLEGFIITMSPQGPLHFAVIQRLARLLQREFEYEQVRAQGPLALSKDSEPEPDLAVVPAGDYTRQHPTSALLVVEVADSSLLKDRNVKARIYAAAGVPEYWIVNLLDRVIEVFTKPEDGMYRLQERRTMTESIALKCSPQVVIQVSSALGVL